MVNQMTKLEKVLGELDNFPKVCWSREKDGNDSESPFSALIEEKTEFKFKGGDVNVYLTKETASSCPTFGEVKRILERYSLIIDRDNPDYSTGFFARIFSGTPEKLLIYQSIEEKKLGTGGKRSQLEEFFEKINNSYDSSVGEGLRIYKNGDLITSLEGALSQ